jgi:cation diffusion facilitator CzcD-associated flavoprotein CzcO
MDDVFGIPPGKHPTGEAVHRYIRAYSERSDILKLVDFETKVLEIEQIGPQKGWNLKVSNGSLAEVQTKKLIIATGATNVPHRPKIQNIEAFNGPIIHSGELGKKSTSLTEDASVQTIAVLGGGKSAYDAVYLAATAGRNIEWIIRKSGKGPEWIFPSHTYLGPFKALREKLPSRRIVSVFSPTLWKDGLGVLRYFLHFTSIGKKIAQKFWANLHLATLTDCGMLKDESTKVLEPETGFVP